MTMPNPPEIVAGLSDEAEIAGRRFRVMVGNSISDEVTVPWSLAEPHRATAERNYGQTLERLHQRGGLDWDELLAVLEDRPWWSMNIKTAEARVRAHLMDHPHAE